MERQNTNATQFHESPIGELLHHRRRAWKEENTEIRVVSGETNLILRHNIKLNFPFCKEKPLFGALLTVYQTDVWSVRCIRCHIEQIHRTNQTSVWYTVKRAPKSGFSLQKGKFSFIGAYMPNQPYN